MVTDTIAEQAAMEKQAVAVDRVMREIYVPAFVKACAAHGLQFQSEEQLMQALETTAKLAAVQAATIAAADPISKVAAALDEVVGAMPQAQAPVGPRQLSPEAVEALAALVG